jgi:hypothetical protein
MKTLGEINQTLSSFSQKYNIPVNDVSQGSEAWSKLKLGVISASNASKVVAKKDSDTRLTYMAELVAQISTGIMEEINSKYLDWGNQQEAAARSSYVFAHDCALVELPFVFRDESFREGCSPDALLGDGSKGIEIKCPYNSVHYIKFLTEDKIKPEYVWQYQYTLRVLDADTWDFVQYDPRMKKKPMHIVTVKRDEEKQKTFDDLIPAFIEDMDSMLAKVGIKFGEQWERV